MDTFEKNLAKKELETLQAINRNINFLGRKLEMTNNILGKYGIAILPGAEEIKEQKERSIRVDDILEWAGNGNTVESDAINKMLEDLIGYGEN